MRRVWVSQGGGPADVMRIDLRLFVTLMSCGPDHAILDIQLGLHCTAIKITMHVQKERRCCAVPDIHATSSCMIMHQDTLNTLLFNQPCDWNHVTGTMTASSSYNDNTSIWKFAGKHVLHSI